MGATTTVPVLYCWLTSDAEFSGLNLWSLYHGHDLWVTNSGRVRRMDLLLHVALAGVTRFIHLESGGVCRVWEGLTLMPGSLTGTAVTPAHVGPSLCTFGSFHRDAPSDDPTSNTVARKRKGPDSADRVTSTIVCWSKQTGSLPNFQ